MIRWVHLFPAALLVLQLAAGVAYAAARDIRHAVYWFAAAVLTAVVTW